MREVMAYPGDIVAMFQCFLDWNGNQILTLEHHYLVHRIDFPNLEKADSYQIYNFQIHLMDCNFIP
jgi:hypothetical protein